MFQFQALAGFSAVVDRLGEFAEALEACKWVHCLAAPCRFGKAHPGGHSRPIQSEAGRDEKLPEAWGIFCWTSVSLFTAIQKTIFCRHRI